MVITRYDFVNVNDLFQYSLPNQYYRTVRRAVMNITVRSFMDAQIEDIYFIFRANAEGHS